MTVKDMIRYKTHVHLGNKDNRAIRNAMAELAIEEGIHFVNIGRRSYLRIELCTEEEKERYFKLYLSSFISIAKRLNSMKKHLNKEQKEMLYDGNMFKIIERYDLENE